MMSARIYGGSKAVAESVLRNCGCRRSFSASSSSDAQRRAYEHYLKKNRNNSWWRRRSSANQRQQSVHERNVQVAWYAAAAVVGALGATYASVPLYKIFCQATGFGGTTQRVSLEEWASQQEERETTGIPRMLQNLWKQIAPATPIRNTGRVHTWTDEEAAAKLASLKPLTNGRLITVRFDSTVGDVLPWDFVPTQLDVKVVPGETALSFFTVTNHSDKAITGVATYNVHPPKAGLYFQKIQCFCFEEQRLLPGETVDMPVFFFIDPDFVKDPQLKHVNSITLSYTFFQTDQEDDDDDDEEDD
jgi:cytochrome c oxidase assembly protein subunit 11